MLNFSVTALLFAIFIGTSAMAQVARPIDVRCRTVPSKVIADLTCRALSAGAQFPSVRVQSVSFGSCGNMIRFLGHTNIQRAGYVYEGGHLGRMQSPVGNGMLEMYLSFNTRGEIYVLIDRAFSKGLTPRGEFVERRIDNQGFHDFIWDCAKNF
jgi:hypothetical protein